ncbi:hypothetical protein G7077_07405 [Sphingomonas piscis]|uniref:DUF4386 domain-containing protein n=1 Tax=Sphingomonas piscis TaxID=2714943 RepID=A0A6G7YPT8_9SPHN|nr:hypothetical protein [Sphingomonas piscis]QIK78747.1 hypothetical protein G7077_07405 [Sphingomonas piscis]
MASRQQAGALASFAAAALTIAGMGVGIGIMQAMSVASGMEVASASVEALRAARPLLIAAELLKIVTGIAIIVAVTASRRRWRISTLAAGLGYAAALLVMAAGVVGLFAVLALATSSPRMGAIVGLLGLLSLPATGAWAALSTWGRPNAPRSLRMAAILLAISGVATLVFPPVGLLFGVASLLWWITLGLTLRRPA